jgi:hypothetical protein
VVNDPSMTDQHRVWEGLAQSDPLWAILSDPQRKGNRWQLDEFFASGRRDVEANLADLASLGIDVRPGRALDFGCGVGRLTQALGASFERADGVDIAETMVELAREYNRHGDRVQYHVNQEPNLGLFEDGAFDFVLSIIVLQHNPPPVAEGYIREFVRVLAPGGIADFDMTSELTGTPLEQGSHRAALRLDAPSRMTGADPTTVRVTVTNTSPVDWPAKTRLAVGNHWRTANGRSVIANDDGRTRLAEGLPAGSTTVVDLTVTPPATGGRLRLEVDLVDEGVCWFADVGSPTADTKVKVDASSAVRVVDDEAVDTAEEPAEAQAFEMHGLSRQRVEAAVVESGGRVLHVAPSERGGENWDGFRYIVTRD